MNFQQLRYVRETVRRGYSLTEVAHTLHTSQPGVSRQIRELERNWAWRSSSAPASG
jgi:LysR family cys regulon transcriptional activator